MAWNRRGKLSSALLVLQGVFVVLFAVLVDYDSAADNRQHKPSGSAAAIKAVDSYYPMFQDVHVMMFIGFGFIMTFLTRYGFNSVGINFLLAAVMIQWATLVNGFFHLSAKNNWRIPVNMQTLLLSDFAAAAVLISMCANLGKLSPLQYVVMGIVEMVFFVLNEWLGLEIMLVSDAGGGMFVHVFGAYFGLAVSRVLYTSDLKSASATKECSNYHSDMFAMIATIFLWLYWPSFNGALSLGDDRHRVVINTYYALAACCVVTFAVSALVDKHDKLDMVHVQNATLAGGVAIGTVADMMVFPYGAILIGSAGGALSVLGFKYITPRMNTTLKTHDTCGVNNLHGIPGILTGILGAIMAAIATEHGYGIGLYELFPARTPKANSTEFMTLQRDNQWLQPGLGRSGREQAGWQIVALVVTFFISIIGGLFTGFLLKLPIWNQPFAEEIFEDEPFWDIPNEGYPSISVATTIEPKVIYNPSNGFNESLDTVSSKMDPSISGSQQHVPVESTHV